jgi:hypothetical protein
MKNIPCFKLFAKIYSCRQSIGQGLACKYFFTNISTRVAANVFGGWAHPDHQRLWWLGLPWSATNNFGAMDLATKLNDDNHSPLAHWRHISISILILPVHVGPQRAEARRRGLGVVQHRQGGSSRIAGPLKHLCSWQCVHFSWLLLWCLIWLWRATTRIKCIGRSGGSSLFWGL